MMKSAQSEKLQLFYPKVPKLLAGHCYLFCKQSPSWKTHKARISQIRSIPLQSEELRFLTYQNVTFVKGKWALIFDNFGETIYDTLVLGILLILGLESDLNDFKGLHDSDLGPAFVKRVLPVTMPFNREIAKLYHPLAILIDNTINKNKIHIYYNL